MNLLADYGTVLVITDAVLLELRKIEVYTNSISYDEKVSRVFTWYTRFPGKEYTFQPVSHHTNFCTLNAVDTT